MESPTKRKTGKARLEEENKEILSSESSIKSKSNNDSKLYSPSTHKKRISKAEKKKVKNARRRLERLTISNALIKAHEVAKIKSGEALPVFSKESGNAKCSLVLKRTDALEVKRMLSEIKKKRYTTHIAFTKAVKELGNTNVEIYKLYQKTLEDEIKQTNKKGLDLNVTAKYLHGILDGVASFHAAEYIHGDLKPNNIAISSGVIKLIDYDMSQKIIGRKESTANAFYAQGGITDQRRTDIFAIGCIFVEMLLGKTMRDYENEEAAVAIQRAKTLISKKYREKESKMIISLLELIMSDECVDAEKLLYHDFFDFAHKRMNADKVLARDNKKKEKKEKAKRIKKKAN